MVGRAAYAPLTTRLFLEGTNFLSQLVDFLGEFVQCPFHPFVLLEQSANNLGRHVSLTDAGMRRIFGMSGIAMDHLIDVTAAKIIQTVDRHFEFERAPLPFDR